MSSSPIISTDVLTERPHVDCILAFLPPVETSDTAYFESLAEAIKGDLPLHVFVAPAAGKDSGVPIKRMLAPETITVLSPDDDQNLELISSIISKHSRLRPLLLAFDPSSLRLAELVYSPIKVLGIPPSVSSTFNVDERACTEHSLQLEHLALFAERQADLAIILGESDRQFIQSSLAFLGTSWFPKESGQSLGDTADKILTRNHHHRRLFPHKLELLLVLASSGQQDDPTNLFTTERLAAESCHRISASLPWTSRQDFAPSRLYDAILTVITVTQSGEPSARLPQHLESHAGYKVVVTNQAGLDSQAIKDLAARRQVHHVIAITDSGESETKEMDEDWRSVAGFCELSFFNYSSPKVIEDFDELLSRRLRGRPNWQLHGHYNFMSNSPPPPKYSNSYWETEDQLRCLGRLAELETQAASVPATFDSFNETLKRMSDEKNELTGVIRGLEMTLEKLKKLENKRPVASKKPSLLRRLIGRHES